MENKYGFSESPFRQRQKNVEHMKTLCSSFGTQHIDVVNKGIPKKQKLNI